MSGSLSYNGRQLEVVTPYLNDLFGTDSSTYKKLMLELNTASQHLLIEVERMSLLDRKLTEEEQVTLMRMFDRQITAQSALQRHLHSHYDGTEYVG